MLISMADSSSPSKGCGSACRWARHATNKNPVTLGRTIELPFWWQMTSALIWISRQGLPFDLRPEPRQELGRRHAGSTGFCPRESHEAPQSHERHAAGIDRHRGPALTEHDRIRPDRIYRLPVIHRRVVGDRLSDVARTSNVVWQIRKHPPAHAASLGKLAVDVGARHSNGFVEQHGSNLSTNHAVAEGANTAGSE